jgi:crotonobetainyl-CoA:carnitine CoA-transferase CaiB-like acyl-CoA transferase
MEKIGSDPVYSSNAGRLERRDEVMNALTAAVSRLTRAELVAKLDAVDVPIGPVNDVAEILADPHVRARKLVGSFDYPGVGEFRALGLPYKFLGWDDPQIGRPPELGEHTDQILRERLGYSAERIEELRKSRAI